MALLTSILCATPRHSLAKSVENALVNPDNPYILRAHLLCAAWELPLGSEEVFGAAYERERVGLEGEGLLRERKGRWYLAPAIAYPLRA